MKRPLPLPRPVATPTGEGLQDVIIGQTYNTDDGHMQWEILDCYPDEVDRLLPALAKIQRQSRWPRSVKSLTIIARNGKKRVVVFGDRITFVTVRPARGTP